MADPNQKELQNITKQLSAIMSLSPQDSAAGKPNQPEKGESINRDFQNSAYYKICALASQLHPYFIELLKTPDFRNCESAHVIRMKINHIMELYNQMIIETDQLGTSVSENTPLAGESLFGEQFSAEHKEAKTSETLNHKRSLQVSEKKKPKKTPISSDKKPNDFTLPEEGYVVGGSVYGWNFITNFDSKPVYYGVTKESFRSNHDH